MADVNSFKYLLSRLDEYLLPHAAKVRKLARYMLGLGTMMFLATLALAFSSNFTYRAAALGACSLVGIVGLLFGIGMKDYGIAQGGMAEGQVQRQSEPDLLTLVVRHKPLQAILLILFGVILWVWALQIQLGMAQGTTNQVGLMFFVGLAALIFGGYKARQIIDQSASEGGVGKHFTLHNFGFLVILLGLYCWYLAWRVFEAPSTSPVEAELILKSPVLGAIVGFLLLGIGYNFVNPSKSQYARDIERHGYPRPIPSKVRYEVWARDSGRCVNCGSTENLHFDHIIPYSKGGSSTDPNNIRVLCSRCNLHKSDRIE